MTKIPNPLYDTPVAEESKRPKGDGAIAKDVTIARIDNAIEGVCPKCQRPMGVAALGAMGGSQKVHFCNTCRIATPRSDIA